MMLPWQPNWYTKCSHLRYIMYYRYHTISYIYLFVFSKTMSPALPTSMEPLDLDSPRAAAELMVAAASASGMFICSNTQARCITRGYIEREREDQ